ncbi:MAG TPA: methyltransferase domain-containing protein [Acidobacteriota bacterium]|nr:methyltransferase domain-containing protein [Acidobacteriota bacterium]
MPWNPECFVRFRQERYAPFDDLVRLVRVRPGLDAIDLGCGPGELTSRLSDLLPRSSVVGIDSSAAMLEKAQSLSRPGLRFELRPIEQMKGDWDLVFSHAAIQWVDDHRSLIPKLFSHVRPGGQLVVQVPANHDHPVLRLIVETAAEPPFQDAMGGWHRESPVLPLQEYGEILYAMGGKDLTILEKVYPHVLQDSDALADWTSGTALVPYMERLPKELHEPYMMEYRKRLRIRYPESPVFFGFRRILFSASREPQPQR